MHFGLNRSIGGCDNGEKRRKFEEWKNSKKNARSASRITDYFEEIDATNCHAVSRFS